MNISLQERNHYIFEVMNRVKKLNIISEQDFNIVAKFKQINNKTEGNINLVVSLIKFDKELHLKNGDIISDGQVRLIIDSCDKSFINVCTVVKIGWENKSSVNYFKLNGNKVTIVRVLNLYVLEIFTTNVIFDIIRNRVNRYEAGLHSIFIFDRLIWSNIVLWFKLNNIILSGGSGSKRHILSSNQIALVFTILRFFDVKLEELNAASNISLVDKEILSPKYDSEIYLHRDKENFKKIVNDKGNRTITKLLYFSDLLNFLLINLSEIACLKNRLAELKFYLSDSKLGISNQFKDVEDLWRSLNNNKEKIEEFCNKFSIQNMHLALKFKEFGENYDSLIKQLEIHNQICESHSLVNILELDNEHIKNKKLDLNKEKNSLNFNKVQKRSMHLSAANCNINNTKALAETSYFSFLYKVKELLSSSELEPYQIQKMIEEDWIDLMKNKISDKNLAGSQLLCIVKYVKETLDIYYNKTKSRGIFSKFEEDINNEKYVYLTLSLLLTYYDKIGYTAIAHIIGKNILFSYYKEKINKKSEVTVSFAEFKIKLNIDETQIVKIGDIFITFFTETSMFDRIYKFEDDFFKDSFKAVIRLNPDYFEELRENFIPHPSVLPMISEPGIWGENKYGGLLGNKLQQEDIITGSNNHNHQVKNLEAVYNTVNYMSKVKFSINENLLQYLKTKGKYLLDLDLESESNRSLDLHRQISIKIAETFSGFPFYLPVKADWRGRLYTQSFFLSYQASDFSLSLLNFYDGEPLTDKGKKFLYIYGATVYNENKQLSKASFSNRIEWVEKNIDKILNMDPSFISKAESKFVFAAFCLIMRELQSDPNHIVKLPLFLDATCSGIQHLATLLKDVQLASEVNLINKISEFKDERVEDFYANMTEKVNLKLNKLGTENKDLKSFSNLKLTRDHLKSSLMTKTYNVTLYGMIKQIESKLKKITIKDKTYFEINNEDQSKNTINKNELAIIAKTVNSVIFENYESVKHIYDYFIDVSKIMIKLGIPLTWFTPSGLQITQHYLLSKITKASISVGGKSKKIVLREWTSKVDRRKQTQAIIPNIIHSLDASHIHNIIKKANFIKFEPVLTIHDCFGSLPNKMEDLEYLVKSEFVSLYSDNDFLTKFHERFLESIEDNHYNIDESANGEKIIIYNKKAYKLPSKPETGTLDLNQILQSKYMIS